MNKRKGAKRNWRLMMLGGTLAVILGAALLFGPGILPASAVTATNDTANTNEDTGVIVNVLANDSGTGLRVDSTGTPGHGTASIVSGGTSITYTPNANWNGTDSFTYTVLQSANPYYSGTGHYYEFVSVPSGITWSAAQTAAAGKHLYGLQGYLVTITSAGEQNFVNTKLNGSTAWMGASDAASEGTWGWVTGPAVERSTFPYTNWNAGEPNNSGDEDYGQFLGGSTGLWNDLSSTATVEGYVVEYGGMAGDPTAPVEVLTATVYVTVNPVNDAPVNTALPTVSGTMNVGDTLTATSGTWNDNLEMVPGTLSYEYVWQRADSTAGANLTVIPGANSSTYVIGTGSAHKYVRVQVKCIDNGQGVPASISAFVYSAWSSQVANGLPVITEGASTSVTMSEDGSPAPFSLTLNATDVDGDTLTWNIFIQALHGTATASGTGSSKGIGYAPNADYNDSDSFTVRVSDGFGGTDDIVVNVAITAVNDVPVITEGTSASVSMTEDGNPTAFGLTLNATDVEGDTLTWSIQTVALHGTATATGTGASKAIGYSPTANYNGSDAFVVQVSDGHAGTDSLTVNVTISAVNDVPSFAKGVDQTSAEDCGSQSVAEWATNISAGPSNESGQAIDFVVSNDNNALFGVQPAISASGTLTFIPAANANGTATVTVQIHDDGGTANGGVNTSASQTFTITVYEVNDSPVLNSDSFTFDEDAALTLGKADLLSNDLEGPVNEVAPQTLDVTDVANPFHCSVGMVGNVITVVPDSNYNGSASFEYTIRDDGTTHGVLDARYATGTVNLTVTPVNDVPSFTKGTDQTVLEDCGVQTVAGWATAISVGPANESPQVLTFTATNNNNALFSVQPAVSSIGALTWTPAADMNGSATVTLTLTDDATRGGAALTTASQTFTITVTPVNDVPSFTKGADQTVLEDCGAQTVNSWATAISVGPTDEAAQALDFIVTNNNNALFSNQPVLSSTGALTYVPAANANGTATVTVQIHDDGGTTNGGVDTSASQTFTITVTPVNDPPVNTAVPGISGIPHVGRTLATTDGVWNDRIDTDVSGTSILSYAYQWQRSTDGGTVFVDIPGATGPTYVLTLADNLQMVRSRVMCTDDGVGLPLHQTTSELSTPVSVTILNAAPVITEGLAISTSCDEDESPASFVLILHATDSDIIDTLTWHIVTPPAHGTLTLPASSGGSSTVPSFYHPAANWNGMDTFTLQIEDGLTGTDEITVMVTVIPRSDAPINTLRPSIAGNLFVNHEVRAVNGSWNDAIDTDISGTSVLSYTYQWLRARDAAGTELVLIPGATASTYVISAIDEGKYLAVRVTCTDSGVGLPVTMSTTVDSAFLRAWNIDVMSPVITLPNFSSWPGVTGWSGVPVQTFVVNSSPFSLQFTLEDNSGSVKWTIKVNGVVIVDPVGVGVVSYPLPLTEGHNDVEITAVDAKGNATSVKLVIYLDTMSPVLTVEPALPSSVTTSRLTIAGSVVDAVAGLKRVSINGIEVVPFLDGSFRETLALTKGANKIVIETEDKAGHVANATYTVTYATAAQPLPAATVITLTIGKTKMDVSGATVALDTAPVIKESRTMLPIRAVAEAVNASVAWDPVARKVTITRGATRIELWIGKSVAKLNGKSVPIDAANSKVVPCVTNGRTLLPVRFIAEALGLDVGWNTSTRVVTLTLKP